METITEIEKEIHENQISLDFLTEKQTVVVQKSENLDWVSKETLVVIFSPEDKTFEKIDFCGKKMIDWVQMACAGCKTKTMDEVAEEEILQTLRLAGAGFEYVVLLYADTPLLKKSTFLDVVDFFAKKKLNVLKLERGYVFRSEYLENAKHMLSPAKETFEKDDFLVVCDAKSASKAFKTLSKRILAFHEEHGVVFFGKNIYIDADVEIEEGVIVHPDNILKGETYVGKNVLLKSGNLLEDVIVCDDVSLTGCKLQKCKIEKGKTLVFENKINEKI